MTDSQPHYPLDHLNLQNAPQEMPDLLICPRRGLAFCQVMARAEHNEAVATALGSTADTRLAITGEEFTALPLAPGRWMLCAPWGRDGEFTADIAHRMKGIAHASEQSHGRAAFRVSGTAAVELLSRECRLDLAAAPAGFVGQTTMADIGVLIHKVNDTPVFDLILYTGYAEHFWDWLSVTTQPFHAIFSKEITE